MIRRDIIYRYFRYDAAPNHEPCNAGGRKAHWALVKGLVFPKPLRNNGVKDSNLPDKSNKELYMDRLIECKTGERALSDNEIPEKDDVLVIALQGP